MTYIETHHISYLPFPVHIAVYRDLKNAAFLREQLLAGDPAYEYAFLDASMIFSRNHVFAAIFRAVRDFLNNRLKSRNAHSEIVFALSGNNNIADSFRRFGISDSTRHLLVVKIAISPEVTQSSVAGHLEQIIKASPCPFTDEALSSMTEMARIKKIYKFGPVAIDAFLELDVAENSATVKKHIDTLLMSSIAIRGAA